MVQRGSFLFLVVLLALFMLGNKGCETDSHTPSDDQGGDSGDGDDVQGKRSAELELCDACDGPSPGAPNYECKDGSVGGPVCAKKDLGECGWVFRACPEEGSDGEDGDAGSDGDESSVCGSRGSKPCADGQYCRLDETCGATDRGGECADKPSFCNKIYAPVCGCDGKTYGNECTAASQGVSVAHDGECEVSGEICGGFAGFACPKGQYCKYDSHCGFTDGSGVCTDVPEICYTIYAPVCGCDGMTYDNDCNAAAHGMSVVHEGACEGDK